VCSLIIFVASGVTPRKPSHPDPQFIEFLRPYDAPVVELAFGLRRMAIEAAPTAIEIVYDA
jgi:hypothetical protein